MSTYFAIESKLDGNVIDIRESSTATGALLDAFTKKSPAADNQLWEFVADPGGSGFYLIKSKLNGNVICVSENNLSGGSLLFVAPQKTAADTTLDPYSQFWQFFEDPAGSGYCYIMSAYYGYVIDIQGNATAAGTLLDAFPQKPGSKNNQLWRVVDGNFPATTKAVTAPAGGLKNKGNINYFFDDEGKVLTGISVQVTFLEDFSSNSNGYSFQLNCYSSDGPHITTFVQQFVIYAQPGSSQLIARVNTWDAGNPQGELVRADTSLATLPSATFPANYSFMISLGFDSSNGPGTVFEGAYQVVDNNSKVIGNTAIKIVGQNLRTTQKPATVANLASIAAFEFNIGGDAGGVRANLTDGWGTIAYRANNTLHVKNAEPTMYTELNGRTVETANVTFGALPGTNQQLIRQWFQAIT